MILCRTSGGMEITMLPGVYCAQKKDGTIYYRASINYKNKHISLGSYATEKEAHLTYLEAASILNNIDYSIDILATRLHTLSFEKAVCLVNFRVNGMYIKTPIYLQKKFFQYYLSPTEYLIFDIDDLFYYSSHKIMRRQGHYFVSDFGMQVTIQSRNGIKPYAVEGRDYEFINGNSFDYRYENIHIINKYAGVMQTMQGSKTVYKTRIHIHGDYVVGIYPTEEEAAIAYNKAIDVATAQGIKKTFVPNYIEDLSPSTYAEIYHKTKISSKLYALS